MVSAAAVRAMNPFAAPRRLMAPWLRFSPVHSHGEGAVRGLLARMGERSSEHASAALAAPGAASAAVPLASFEPAVWSARAPAAASMWPAFGSAGRFSGGPGVRAGAVAARDVFGAFSHRR